MQLAAAGRYEEAIPHFRFAVERDADYLPGWKNLLAACVEAGRWKEALEAAEKAEELHPLGAQVRRRTPVSCPAGARLCGRRRPASPAARPGGSSSRRAPRS
ncbi:MAG: tetratricopeptide repeat protein [Planctomycetota bacterium]